MNNTLQYYLS